MIQISSRDFQIHEEQSRGAIRGTVAIIFRQTKLACEPALGRDKYAKGWPASAGLTDSENIEVKVRTLSLYNS